MKLINKLVLLQVIEKEDIDLYEYSINILISYILFLLFVTTANFITGNFITTIFFLSIFLILRKYTGGLHLESKTICLIFSISLTLIVPMFASLFRLTFSEILFMQFFFSLLIGLFPVIDTPQKHITNNEKKSYKQKSIIVLLSVFLLNVIFTILKMLELSTITMFTLIISFISVFFGFIKYK